MERIELNQRELDLLERIAKREWDPDMASVEDQDLEIALLDKASELEDSDPALVDERCDYTRDSNLLIWYRYRYLLQEGKCEPWDGTTTDL